MILISYKKITRYTTSTRNCIALQKRIILHVSIHHREKAQRSMDRKREQLEDLCQKQKKQSCRIMYKRENRACSRCKKLTLDETTMVSDEQSLPHHLDDDINMTTSADYNTIKKRHYSIRSWLTTRNQFLFTSHHTHT
jgi:hypothetical protein